MKSQKNKDDFWEALKKLRESITRFGKLAKETDDENLKQVTKSLSEEEDYLVRFAFQNYK